MRTSRSRVFGVLVAPALGVMILHCADPYTADQGSFPPDGSISSDAPANDSSASTDANTIEDAASDDSDGGPTNAGGIVIQQTMKSATEWLGAANASFSSNNSVEEALNVSCVGTTIAGADCFFQTCPVESTPENDAGLVRSAGKITVGGLLVQPLVLTPPSYAASVGQRLWEDGDSIEIMAEGSPTSIPAFSGKIAAPSLVQSGPFESTTNVPRSTDYLIEWTAPPLALGNVRVLLVHTNASQTASLSCIAPTSNGKLLLPSAGLAKLPQGEVAILITPYNATSILVKSAAETFKIGIFVQTGTIVGELTLGP